MLTATETEVSEKPILFSGAMVRAILAGKKTQTRRVVKTDLRPQTEDTFMRGFPPNPENVRYIGMYAKCDAPPGSRSVSYRVPCPYGYLGDRLWVRETYRIAKHHDAKKPSELTPRRMTVAYDAGGYACNDENGWTQFPEVASGFPIGKVRQSIFMPRWASRIDLEITMIGVERLNDISAEDAIAEGIDHYVPDVTASARGEVEADPVLEYEILWESINGAGSWAKNPYVWVIDFRKL